MVSDILSDCIFKAALEDVLILVLMEQVLILVLVEDGLGRSEHENYLKFEFNKS